MLKNADIVCLSYSTWEGPFTKSVVQLLSVLAEDNRVLYVEYPFTLKDLIWTLAGRKEAPVARMLGLRPRLEEQLTAGGTSLLTLVLPPVIPVNSIRNELIYKLVLKIDTRIIQRSLKRAMRWMGMKQPVIVNAYNPIFGEQLLGRLGEKATVYYCYDGFSKDRRGIRAWHADRSFSAKADGIIVSSDFLGKEKLAFNGRVATVKNGVDFEKFSPSARSGPGPAGRRPKIGYIGSIDQRFDLETVEHTVKGLPEFDFEFTGDVRNEAVKAALGSYPNVTFRPPVKASDVPNLLRDCDAGIIPYICNEVNKNVYPLKINEYLAVGVPVVLTRFADLPEFEGRAHFTDSPEAFRDALVTATASDSAELVSDRIAFARSNSWRARAAQFGDALERFSTTPDTHSTTTN